MDAREAAAALIRRLLAEIRGDREAFEARSEDVRTLSSPSIAPTDIRAAALALALDRSYTTLESILERVARTLEGGAPQGEEWHRTLLRNACLTIDRVRPAVLSGESVCAADELRRFRHFLRHAYGAALDPRRIDELATVWSLALPGVRADLDQFERTLDVMADRIEGAS